MEDMGFQINLFWVATQAITLVLFIGVLVVVALAIRRVLRTPRRLDDLDHRLHELERRSRD